MTLSLLWFAPHFQTGVDAGGLRTWVLAKHLVECGHHVSVMVPGWDPLTGERLMRGGRLSNSSQVDGVELIHVWSSRNDRSRLFRRLLYFLTQSVSALLVGLRRRNPDLILAANYPPTLAMAALAVARLRRRPLVLEVRDFPAEAAVASGYLAPGLLSRIALWMERSLFRPAQHIITVAPAMKRRLVELGVPAEKVSVVPNGYEEAIFEAADFDRNVRRELDWGDRFVVLYAGTMGHIPDLPTLLQTALLTADDASILYVLIGAGQREEEYHEFCQRHGLDNCLFLGRRPRSEMPLYCHAADVCVNLFPDHPFWGTILGNKTFDYLGSGTAFIYCGTEPSDTADLLRDSGGGLAIGAADPEALRDAILYLQDHPAERAAMGERGKHYVTRHYSRREIARHFEKVLRRCSEPLQRRDR